MLCSWINLFAGSDTVKWLVVERRLPSSFARATCLLSIALGVPQCPCAGHLDVNKVYAQTLTGGTTWSNLILMAMRIHRLHTLCADICFMQ